MSQTKKSDFLIIGGGVIGLSISLELKKRRPGSKIIIIDKEAQLAFHSSGRNSGVLHAGFYYTADSLKAQFTRSGNQYLKKYCSEKNIPINHCGKLVVTKNESDLDSLNELFLRAEKNNVRLHEIDLRKVKEIEPRALTFKKAAWSPDTSVVNPYHVMKSLAADAEKMGIDFLYSTAYQKLENNKIYTSNGIFEADFIINTAGLYADKIAQDFGMSSKYRILPFKGLYVYCTNKTRKLSTNIYPVPNLKNPFLGVHHTLTADGHSKIGPTAIPAFWREQYKGFERFQLLELISIVSDELSLFFTGGFDFRSLALEEIKKYSRRRLVKEASEMVEGVELPDYQKWGKAGIRAQLFNIESKKLEMDFKIEADSKSLHVLNAISPAFTCSQPFAEYVCNLIGQNVN